MTKILLKIYFLIPITLLGQIDPLLDNDLLVDLIKNCISTHESDGEYLDDRERLEQMLRK